MLAQDAGFDICCIKPDVVWPCTTKHKVFFICKKCYDVRSCLLVVKYLSQKQRKTKQNTVYNISCKIAMSGAIV